MASTPLKCEAEGGKKYCGTFFVTDDCIPDDKKKMYHGCLDERPVKDVRLR